MKEKSGNIRTWPLALLLFFSTSLFAYETPYNDSKLGDSGQDDGATTANSLFKLEGTLWAAYENPDHSPVGKPDDNTQSRYTGFRLGRTYVTARGDVKEGRYKGWGYRVTFDSDPATTKPTFLKFAYVTVPLPLNGLSLRIGQQQTPTTDAQSGRSFDSFWDHRYLDEDGRTPWDEFRLSSSTDIGLSLLYKDKFANLHLMVANGEGYRKTNAQSINTTAADIAKGTGDSHGLDLYGNASITPFGLTKGLTINVSFPFRLQNIVSVERDEYERLDSINTSTGAFRYIKGDKRAKQDVTYGTELDIEFKLGRFTTALGGGASLYIDKRTNVDIYDETRGTLDITSANGIKTLLNSNFVYAKDSKGVVRYVFAHARYNWIGIVGRYSVGTGTGSLNETLGTKDGINAQEQNLVADLKDDGIANGSLTLSQLRALDAGGAQFHKAVLAVEFFVNERFRIAVGASQITASATNGEQLKTSPMDRFPSTYTANAIGQTTAMAAGADAATAAVIKDTDIYGKKNWNRQAFVRTQFLF